VNWLLCAGGTEQRVQPASCVEEHAVLQYSPFPQGFAAGAVVHGTQILGRLLDWCPSPSDKPHDHQRALISQLFRATSTCLEPESHSHAHALLGIVGLTQAARDHGRTRSEQRSHLPGPSQGFSFPGSHNTQDKSWVTAVQVPPTSRKRERTLPSDQWILREGSKFVFSEIRFRKSRNSAVC